MKTIEEESIENELEARLQMIPHHLDRRKFRGLIQRIRTLDKKARDEEMIRDIITMADALELECGKDGDKGTKQWMAFKGFRNTIKDRFLTIKDNLK